MNKVLSALGWGDEGKGVWSEYFGYKDNASLSIRYNGGCQGLHHVHYGEEVHQAQQFSAASLVCPRLKTFILSNVPINPIALIREAEAMEKLGFGGLERLIINYSNPLVISAHNFLCQIRESLSVDPIGTTGIGVRELMSDIATGDETHVLRVRDVLHSDFKQKLHRVVNHQLAKVRTLDAPSDILENSISKYLKKHPTGKLMEKCQQFVSEVGEIVGPPRKNRLLHRKKVIYEPAQGFWLDRQHGTVPYVTSTDTTMCPLSKLRISGNTEIVGLTRAFAARHGPGPFPTETSELSGKDDNIYTEHQGGLRYGWLDLSMIGSAWRTNLSFFSPPDARLSLAISHLDQLSGLEQIPVACSYNSDGNPQYTYLRGWQTDISNCRSLGDLPKEAVEYLGFIQDVIGVPVRYIGVGPTLEHRFEVAL